LLQEYFTFVHEVGSVPRGNRFLVFLVCLFLLLDFADDVLTVDEGFESAHGCHLVKRTHVLGFDRDIA
jgi:hypothetical protein